MVIEFLKKYTMMHFFVSQSGESAIQLTDNEEIKALFRARGMQIINLCFCPVYL